MNFSVYSLKTLEKKLCTLFVQNKREKLQNAIKSPRINSRSLDKKYLEAKHKSSPALRDLILKCSFPKSSCSISKATKNTLRFLTFSLPFFSSPNHEYNAHHQPKTLLQDSAGKKKLI
jgi:hypothetical protein